MRPLLGFLVMHGAGVLALVLVDRRNWRQAVLAPEAIWVSLAGAFIVACGFPGFALAAALAAAVYLGRDKRVAATSRAAHSINAGLIGVCFAIVLARPWVPLYWDEFVWLAKARVSEWGFDAVVAVSLSPELGFIPPGYPPLWPAAVGWLNLGNDNLQGQVFAGSLLVCLSALTALDAWWSSLLRVASRSWVVLLSAPLFLIHLRSVYVDLPVGLLGAALLGRLVTQRFDLGSCAIALCLSLLKDEGATHVAAAVIGALATAGWRRWRVGLPLLVAAAGVVLWKVLLMMHGVKVVDHALGDPAWAWFPSLVRLTSLHASDPLTWGAAWAVGLAVLVRPLEHDGLRALRVALLANAAFVGVALLVGPERVRVFAENGTLLNRLLIQLWPALAISIALSMGDRVVPPGAETAVTRQAA